MAAPDQLDALSSVATAVCAVLYWLSLALAVEDFGTSASALRYE